MPTTKRSKTQMDYPFDAMTVQELIDELEGMDPDRKVILQKDAEGNGYSPLRGADDNAVYVPRRSWCGQVWHERLTDNLQEMGFTEADVYDGEDGDAAVVLHPIN